MTNPANEVPEDLFEVLQNTYAELNNFVLTPEFKSIIDELYSLSPHKQPEFVKSVVINRDELTRRGVNVPDGIIIQRSTFGDDRPTLFVVKKYLPRDYQVAWQNVNLTFDQVHDPGSVITDSKKWKAPLPVPVHAALLAIGGIGDGDGD